MDKWRNLRDSMLARVGLSAGTLIATAAVVGAGFKWGKV